MGRKAAALGLGMFIVLSILCVLRPKSAILEGGISSGKLTQNVTRTEKQERYSYVDGNGNLTLASDRGYAVLVRDKDEEGRLILETYLDEQERPAACSGHYGGIAFRYEGKLQWITYLDTNLEPMMLPSGYSSIRRTVNEKGSALEDFYYDIKGNPAKCSGGYYGLRRSYDEAGRVTGLTYLDSQGNPCRNSTGYSREIWHLNERGWTEVTFYQDTDGTPIRASQGQYGVRYERDETGRVLRAVYLDAEGNPAPVTSGYSILEYRYDEGGKLQEQRYLDGEGQPVALSKGQYGIRFLGDVTLSLNRQGRVMLSPDNLLTGFPWLVVVIGCALCLLLCFLPRPWEKVLLICYVGFIFYETLMFREAGDPRTDLIPFGRIDRFFSSYGVRAEMVNNIWLFVPFGAGLRRLCQKRRMLWLPVALSVAIELTQYVTGLGLMQADDLMTNTLGGAIGFFMAWCLLPSGPASGAG